MQGRDGEVHSAAVAECSSDNGTDVWVIWLLAADPICVWGGKWDTIHAEFDNSAGMLLAALAEPVGKRDIPRGSAWSGELMKLCSGTKKNGPDLLLLLGLLYSSTSPEPAGSL